MKLRFYTFKLIFLLLFTGVFTASGQDFFRVIGGIPHLPSVDPTTVLSPVQGMLIYSTTDQQPMIYGGTSWETLCSSNVSTQTVKDYFEVKTGIPYLSSLTDKPVGTIPSGGIYFSKTEKTMMVFNGNEWTSVAKLYGKGSFTNNGDFSTNSGLQISRLPVSDKNPIPLGLSAGAMYINSVSRSIRYYDGVAWNDISCLPVVSTIPPTKITNTSAQSGADIKSNGGATVTVQGICWGTAPNPDVTLSTKTEYQVFGSDIGLFPSVLSGLKAKTVYHIRAYAINDSGIAYGEDITFTSALASKPTIITLDVSDFTPVSANSGGNITSDGGAPITSRGITWSLKGDPMTDDDAFITSDGSGVGIFPSKLINLLRNTTYYVRAYAVNVMGKEYGNLIEFTTPSATAPVLSSPNIRIVDITDESAVSEVTIINNGGEMVTERGMSWSTDRVNITYGPSTQVNATDIGTFVCNITNLQLGTLYYVRAYAKNIIGTSYSSESSFITTSLPTLTTLEPYNYDAASHRDGWFSGYNGTIALSGGDITSNGVSLITKRGICWSTNPTPTTDLTTKTELNVSGSGTGTFYSYLTSLIPGTTYYVRAYAINSMGTAYGDEMTFKTPQIPDLITKPATDITSMSLSSGGDIVDNGRMPIVSQGLCWNTTNDPDLEGAHTTNGSTGQGFISLLKNLMGNTTYYIRAYATNYVGTNYGEILEVTTAAPIKPVVITSEVSNTAGSATTGAGDVTSNGGADITSRGVVWSLTPNFTPDLSTSNKSQVAGGTGRFNSPITGLSPNKTYYVRAYAVNSAGVEFGNEVIFKTFTIPSLTTTPVSNITGYAAISGGDIFSDGGDKVTTSGIVWSTSPNPTTDLPTKTRGGTGIGSFIHNITGLLGSTTYYVRAYATNYAGTAYGNEYSFTTSPPVLPEVETVEATEITGGSAVSGGLLITNGGALLSKSGIVWDTVSGFVPDQSSVNKTVQFGQGNFASSLTNLTPGTTYYVRAYAQNSVGLVYGKEIVFKTASLAVLTTLVPIPSSITSISATSGGSIINNGGSYIRSNGVCWSTSENPTLADKNVVSGSGSGNFTSNLTDLWASTKYYVRAFATNFAGTAYGQQESFTTDPPVPSTITTLKVTDMTGTTANSGGDITSNGGALISIRGLVWSTNQGFDPATVTTNKTAETGYEKGIFYSQMKGLTPGTIYYVRAYAVSIAGTAYGEERSFVTPNMATIETNSPGLVTNTTAVMGGTITDSGGSPVTARGVLWSTVNNFDPNSTIIDKTANGGGVGSFSTTLKDLIPDTRSYVRAYAVTIAGPSYGQQVGFTTYSPTLPVLTTVVPNRITGVTAYSGGNIEDEGGVTAATRGVYYSTVPNFSITASSTKQTTQSGTGKGVFPSLMQGLTPGTTYYVRAYASNRVGTAYGEELSFTTQTTPILTTINITANAGITAMSGGVISSNGSAEIIAQGVCWSTNPNPTVALATKTSDPGAGVFTSKLIGLAPVTKYYVRAYATNAIGTSYGNEISFTTTPIIPLLTTSDAVITSNTTASAGGTISNNGGATITERGIVFSRKANFNPAVDAVVRTSDGQGIGTFISELYDLEKSRTYYFRAYAVNSAGTAYGNQLTIAIFASSPTLITTKVTEVAGTTATSGGEIESDGGAEVTRRGVVWSKQQNPTITLPTRTSDVDLGDGKFISRMTGLEPNTIYYVRAYAINGIGVAYGLQESFITLALPTLTATDPVTNIRATTATSGGEITDDGRTPILTRGIVWDTYSNPDIYRVGTRTVDNVTQGIGHFTADMTGLLPNTTYYVRAYATNKVGVNYGSEVRFKTNVVTVPILTTSAVTDIEGYSAKGGGNVIEDGGMPVVTRGLVWSINPDPTIALPTKIVNGTAGLGTFENVFAGLIPGTTYYVRAFATNSKGTGYGEEVTFNSSSVVPSMSNVTISNAKMTTADGKANLIFDGGSVITDLGLAWNTVDTIPVAPANHLSVGSTGTDILGTIAGLLPATKYYVWAYGTNAKGSGYSLKSATFSTPDLPKIITTKITAIAQSTANSGGSGITDGGIPITMKGICWSTAENPTIDLTTKTEQGQGVAAFASSMTGLTKGTTYYVRAYATNAMGTSYGNQETFKTIDIPALTTVVATDILSISAKSGGEIITDGGAAITVKGIVWDAKENPEITLTTKTNDGKGIDNFISKMFPLIKSTKYYYRAYATNSIGTAYGQQEELTTQAELPVLSVVTMSDMTLVSAKGTAEVTSDGGAEVTTKGLVWNTTGDPTLDNGTVMPKGAGPGIFNDTIEGLMEGPTYYVRAYATNSIGTAYSPTVTSFKVCLPTFTVSHIAGLNGAPVTKTVTYNSVSTNISGAARCWITQNLGADQVATSATDATEGSSGWYWQFNRLQGYKMDGTTRTPGTAWNTNINENSDWTPANDPCVQLIGGGWRMPTGVEWTNTRGTTQNWATLQDGYNSVLKMHAAGFFSYTGVFVDRGVRGYYWSSTQVGSGYASVLYFTTGSGMITYEKTYGWSVRCLRDQIIKTTPSVSDVVVPAATMKDTSAEGTAMVTPDGGAPVTKKGLVWNTTGNPTLDDNVIDSGSGIGAISGTMTRMEEGPTYYVKAFATNSEGTSYSVKETTFKICKPFTVIHKAGLNGAPVDKTVTYGSINSIVSGEAKCWITQNLGADKQATVLTDVTEQVSGWYWQFNRIQGYKHDGTTRTPNDAWTPWVTSIAENSNWLPANDPCVQLLGGGWRIPTATEWNKAAGAPQNWTTQALAFAGELKLHAAAILTSSGAKAAYHGYWSSTQYSSNSYGMMMYNGAGTTYYEKASALPLRCLRDAVLKSGPSVSNVSVPVAKMTAGTAEGSATVTYDGGSTVTARGLVWNTTGNPTIDDMVISIGSGIGDFSGVLNGLVEGPTYYVRAFATNAQATEYSPLVTSFKICNPFTVIHEAGLNGAPVTKTVTYNTVSTSMSGAPRCWITQNLGADKQATTLTDATEPASGWYWQFNRSKGFKYEGTTRTPNDAWTPWITSIAENSAWLPENDPCVLLLGGGWRMPTGVEWTTAAAPPQYWISQASAYASLLKLHAAGILTTSGAKAAYHGYWSSTQYSSNSFGMMMYNGAGITHYEKANALPIRCLRDTLVKYLPTVSNVLVPVADMTESTAKGSAIVSNDGGSKVTVKGLVWNTTGTAPTLADQVINSGAGTGNITGILANLVEGPTYYVRAFATSSQGTAYSTLVTSFKICNPLTVIHKAGLNGAPVSKTVTYKTVNTSVSGAARCWITQNLGSDQQATAVNDATEASAGWYWQFNKIQGFKFDGTTAATRLPNDAWTPWITSNAENANWAAENDPCTLLLGGGWRIPTQTEWTTAAAPPQYWLNPANSYASELKLHSAGFISAGSLTSRGSYSAYWTSTQYSSTSFGMFFYNGSQLTYSEKATAMPLRCLRDAIVKKVPSVSKVAAPVAEMTASSADGSATVTTDGGAEVTERGLVWNTTGTPTLSDNVIKIGRGTGDFKGTLANLVEGPTYYVRAYATNSEGTGYSTLVTSFKICNPFTVIHKKGLNGAPVDKTVTYKTVSTSVSGAARCWITQNLGADQQAIAVSDASEASAGWYWQFNKFQGFKFDGTTTTTRLPNDAWTPWITSNSENSAWTAANDPCVQLLGGGWRIPTLAEWTAAAAPPQYWLNPAQSYASELKLHAAGYISSATLTSRGSYSAYWSSTQYSSSSFGMFFYNGSQLTYSEKATAMPLRCLRDTLEQNIPSISNVIVPVAQMTVNTAEGTATVASDGGSPVTERGLVWNTTGMPTLKDQVIPVGKGTGDIKGTLVTLVEGPTYYVRAYATNSAGTAYSTLETSFKICNPFTVIHKAGLNGAPVDKTVIYKTVNSSISGDARCWITQNLGSDKQADAVSDATEAAAGWFWQFNRSQGFKHDGTVRTPNPAWATWIPSISENLSWDAANDPCTLLLGGGWRMPTAVEWTKAAAPPQYWTIPASAYASELKMHSAGYLTAAGAVYSRGQNFSYWSSTQYNVGNGWYLYNGGTQNYIDKAAALPVRCLRDVIVKRVPSVSNVSTPVAEMTANSADGSATITNDGAAEITESGLVWSTTGTPTLDDQVIRIGKGTGDIKGTLANLIEGPTYYVRAYATNSQGTAYSTLVTSFKICNPFTIIHKGGLNGAPVDKTVIYKTVTSNISGEARCWITQNLGSDKQADAVADATEPAAGWFWQFNRSQGFKHDGIVRTPNPAWSTWIASISETANWLPENDPCILLLGGGWRMPTAVEWTKAAAPPQYWTIPASAYASELKMHSAGYLTAAGAVYSRGQNFSYWSSTQYNVGNGWYLYNGGTQNYIDKAAALPVRCLRDVIVKTIPSVSNLLLPTDKMTASTVEATATVALNGNSPVTERGFVWNTSGLPTTSDQKLALGTGTGIITGVLTGLTEGPSYFVRGYATNSQGTVYSPVESTFKICRPLTINHTQAINGAPVNKVITYGTVSSSISGAAKCWITQNLGASQQADAVGDATEASGGWYFQFNRSQGYKSDAGVRTPDQAQKPFVGSISENISWTSATDPCTNLLGADWRLPTAAEWTKAAAQPQFWTLPATAFASEFKMHMAGYLSAAGTIYQRGQNFSYWSSTQYNVGNGWYLYNGGTQNYIDKAAALPVRCLKD